MGYLFFYKPELEQMQFQMAQTQMLRGEVGARALRVLSVP
jgi:hypothetical protein